MAKIYVLMGKSATGKDTVYQRVMEQCKDQFRNIVTYTTRPKRSGEQEGRDYYFATPEELLQYEKEKRIIELRTYQTVHGPWHYFTLDDGQIKAESDDKFFIINTLEAYQKYLDYFGKDVMVPIYIEISEKERIHRALRREDLQSEPKYSEMCRRFLADEADFSEEKLAAAGITEADRFVNEDLETCVELVKNRICGR